MPTGRSRHGIAWRLLAAENQMQARERRITSLLRHVIAAFLTGAVAVLLVHQPVIALLHWAGATPIAAYSLRATSPWGVPVLLSLSFWGGVWTIPIAWALDRLPRRWFYWLGAMLLGAVPPTLTTWIVIFPMRGLPPAAFNTVVPVALMANGTWGLGIGILWTMIASRQHRKTA
jgi:hypothetical protein